MDWFYLALLILGAVMFLLETFHFSAKRGHRWVNFIALGLFFWILVPLLQTVDVLNK